MSRRLLLIDAGIAAAIAALVVFLSPGLAVAGIIGLLVLLACLISFGVGRLRRGHRARVARRMNAMRRTSALSRSPARRRTSVARRSHR